MSFGDRFGGLSTRTLIIFIATLVVGILHHADHVLRFDHSGWPFRPHVNPFTYSLLVYPIALFVWFGPARLFWLRWVVLLIGAAFTLYAHFMIETPHMQYAIWAHDQSLDPHQPGAHNLLDVQAPFLGVLAVGLSMTLNILVVAAALSMLWDGVNRGGKREAAARHPAGDRQQP